MSVERIVPSVRVLKPEEMAKADRAAVEVAGISSLELMEKAGLEVARVARQMLSESGGNSVAIWSGTGNNGGDGFVAARYLGRDSSLDVSVFVVGSADRLRNDAKVNFKRLENSAVKVFEVNTDEKVSQFLERAPRFDLVVDAVFGTGFRGEATGIHASVIEAINEYGAPILSVDIPSGVCGNTGSAKGPAVAATKTVTFQVPKVGIVQYPGAAFAGELEIVDIGIPENLIEKVAESRIYLLDEGFVLDILPVRAPDAHKGSCGRVLVIGGSTGLTGAVALCAQACLRAGAGVVTAGIPESLNLIMEVKLTEVMSMPLPDTGRGSLSVKAVGPVLESVNKFDVMAIGPGLGRDTEAVEFVREILQKAQKPVVLDADGLNALVGSTEILSERKQDTIITPHPGEMARLMGISPGEVQADRVSTALKAAHDWKCVVVLKGAGTLIAEPAGRLYVNSSGNPGMASAGMGDVLTGCVAAFVARGLPVFDAAAAGAFIHGHAADLSAALNATEGMIARDVIGCIPLAMRRENRRESDRRKSSIRKLKSMD